MRQRESAVPARVVASAIKPNAPAKGGPKHSGWLLRIPLTRSHGKTQEGGNRERPSACCLERSMKDCRRCPQRSGGFSGGREPESRIRRVADKCIDGSAQANARTSAFLCGPPCLGRRQRRPFLASGQPPSALRHLPGILPQAQLTAGKQGQDVGGLVRPALFHAGPKLQAGFLRIAAFSLGIRPQVVEIEVTAANQRRYQHRRHPPGTRGLPPLRTVAAGVGLAGAMPVPPPVMSSPPPVASPIAVKPVESSRPTSLLSPSTSRPPPDCRCLPAEFGHPCVASPALRADLHPPNERTLPERRQPAG